MNRNILKYSSIVLFIIGVLFVMSAFMVSMNPSESALINNDFKNVEVDVSKIEIGEHLIVEWHKKPIVILRRDPNVIKNLIEIENELFDPHSNIDHDPKYIKKIQRSIKSEYFVAIATSTYCGCMLNYRESYWVYNTPGGVFYDPCNTGVYDSSGRVFKETMKKPGSVCQNKRMSNMVIPPHKYSDKNTIILGEI